MKKLFTVLFCILSIFALTDEGALQRFNSAMDTYNIEEYELSANILKSLRSDMRSTAHYPITIYMQALSSFKHGNLEEAIEVFSNFASQYPDHPLAPRAKLYCGNAYFLSGDYASAANEYLAPIATGPPNEKRIASQAIDNLAWGYLSIQELQALLEQAPISYQLDLSLAMIKRLEFAGKNAQALKQGESLVKHYPTSSKIKEIKKINQRLKESLSNNLTIGVILPFSGDPDFVEYGSSVLNGVKLAFKQWEAKSGKKINLLIRDSAAEPLKCVQAAEELIESVQPICIVGPLLSDEAVALGTLGGAHKIPIITPTATKTDLATISPYFFQISTTPKNATRALLLYSISELFDSSFAILAPNDSEGRMLAETAFGVIDARGGSLISAKYYNPEEVDFSEELVDIKEPILKSLDRRSTYADSTDSIFYDYRGVKKERQEWTARFDAFFIPPSFSEELLNILPQIPFNYIEARLLGSNAWIAGDVTDRSIAKYSEGAIFVPDQFYVDEDDESWIDFERLYSREYSDSPDRLAALGYNSGKLITNGFDNNSFTPELMKTFLAQVQNFECVTQKITFNGQGSNTYTRIYTIEKREMIKKK